MRDRLGKFLVVDEIAKGGMAEVYLAKRFGLEGTNRVIALKCIRTEISREEEFVALFVEEAKLSIALTHPNIAQVYEIGRVDDVHFIAMEYVPGRTLRDIIDRIRNTDHPLPEPLALYLAAQVLDGLEYAHFKTDPGGHPLGIVHQDVSPQNVLIGYAGQVKLIDFGIARATAVAPHAKENAVRGKYGYMSPEQACRRDVDHRSDIFSAGVLLYELLTQRRLFVGTSDYSVVEKVKRAEVYPPSVLVPTIVSHLEDIVLRALRVDPQERFESASQMQDALVEHMLKHHGNVSARHLAAFMGELFPKEIETDQARLEAARRIQDVQIEKLAQEEEVARAHGAEVEAAPVIAGDAKDVTKLDITQPEDWDDKYTDTDPAAYFPDLDPEHGRKTLHTSRSRTREQVLAPITSTYKRYGARNMLTIAGALLIAFGLVLGTWYFTRKPSEPARAALLVQSTPSGSTVLVDGKQIGRTPLAFRDLGAGTHVVTVLHVGFESESRVIQARESGVTKMQVVLQGVVREENPRSRGH